MGDVKLDNAVTVRFTDEELRQIDADVENLCRRGAGTVATRASVVRGAWIRDYVSRETPKQNDSRGA